MYPLYIQNVTDFLRAFGAWLHRCRKFCARFEMKMCAYFAENVHKISAKRAQSFSVHQFVEIFEAITFS